MSSLTVEFPPLGTLVLFFVLWLLFCAGWFRVLKKAEIPLGWSIPALLCAFLSPLFQPLMLVPLAIAALVPWPVSDPPYVRRRRSN